jgi:hypothetical protein
MKKPHAPQEFVGANKVRGPLGMGLAALSLVLVSVLHDNRLLQDVSGLRQQSNVLLSESQVPPAGRTMLQTPAAPPVGVNTCKCLAPIPSEASAVGACTRTQDGGSFCELTFSLPQRAAAMSGLSGYDKYSSRWNLSISKHQIPSLVDRLEEGELASERPEQVADSLRAVAAVAAFERPNDAALQSHFRDIFEMLEFKSPSDREPVIRSITHFAASPDERGLQVDRTNLPNGRSYELVTTPGCITFGESKFSFMIRRTATATPCEVPQ